MSKRLKAYYDFIAQKPCLKCNRYGVEVAHVAGIISPKTDLPMPRRKGVAQWAAVPLCPDCHRTGRDSIHNVGEDQFSENLGRGHAYLWKKTASLIAEFMEGQRG